MLDLYSSALVVRYRMGDAMGLCCCCSGTTMLVLYRYFSGAALILIWCCGQYLFCSAPAVVRVRASLALRLRTDSHSGDRTEQVLVLYQSRSVLVLRRLLLDRPLLSSTGPG